MMWNGTAAAAQPSPGATVGTGNTTAPDASAAPSSAPGPATHEPMAPVAVPWGGASAELGPVTPVGDAPPSPRSQDQSETIAKLVAGQPEWGCDYEAHAITERHVIVACHGGLVLTLVRTQTGVQLIGRRQVNGRVTDFYEQGDSVWARVISETAEAIIPGSLVQTGSVHRGATNKSSKTSTAAGAGASAESRSAAPAPPVRGTVSRVDGRDIVVTLRAKHGIQEGDRMALSRPAQGSDAFFADDPVVARVVRVMGDQALLRVGMNEVVAVGYDAERTSERETASRRSPPRVYDVWELRSVMRPILNLGSVGGGVSGELGLTRRTEYFRFGLDVSPLAVAGATGRKTLFSGGGYVFGAVDHAVYSAGVGLGANTVRDTDSESDAGSGLSVVQLLRLGAVDGMHLQSRVEAVIFRSEVLFGYLQLQGQLAVADSTWLVVRGGGGSVGYGFGEVVLRNLLWGTGAADSTFLELGLGGAGLFQQSCPEVPPVVSVGNVPQCTDVDIGGPMFTAGLEWRL